MIRKMNFQKKKALRIWRASLEFKKEIAYKFFRNYNALRHKNKPDPRVIDHWGQNC